MQVWPAAFPQVFEVNGFSLDAVNNSEVLDVESGAPLTRRRFTGAMDDISGTLFLVESEVAEQIRQFHRIDCKDGSLPFLWHNPLTGSAVRFLFLSPPKLIPESGGLWRVQLHLRSLPV